MIKLYIIPKGEAVVHIHEEVLLAATEIAARPGNNGVFTVRELVQRLPHLNERSVRTHVGSRCCVNAPKNHPHKWNYFRRVRHGRYEIMPEYRRRKKTAKSAESASRASVPGPRNGRPKETIHVIVSEDRGTYTAECVEVSVVTQGRSLDELLKHLTEAISLHLEGEDLADFGLSGQPRLQLLYEVPLAV
jgi:predicted RNase H-like HicB family nuclease